jgi:hypothetical protein
MRLTPIKEPPLWRLARSLTNSISSPSPFSSTFFNSNGSFIFCDGKHIRYHPREDHCFTYLVEFKELSRADIEFEFEPEDCIVLLYGVLVEMLWFMEGILP